MGRSGGGTALRQVIVVKALDNDLGQCRVRMLKHRALSHSCLGSPRNISPTRPTHEPQTMVESSMTYERLIESAATALASGDRAAAEQSLRAAVRAVEAVPGAHLDHAAALLRLGALRQDAGALDEAAVIFERALSVGEASLGDDDLALVPALTRLGAAKVMSGSIEDASILITRAVTIGERHLGEDHPDLVILLNDLSRLYLKHGAHRHAEPLLLRLLTIKRSKGEDHPEVATVLASLAVVRQALGRHESAEQLWRQVLSIRERTLAPNHFAIATALEHLGETCAARAKYREALQLLRRAQSIRELTLGGDHPSLRASRERIADLELQASEDFLDASDSLALPLDRPRLPTGDHLGLGMTPRSLQPTYTPTVQAPRPTQAPRPSHALQATAVLRAREAAIAIERAATRMEDMLTDRVEAPQAAPAPQANSQAQSQAEPDPAPYLNVLMDIKGEMDEDGAPAGSEAEQPRYAAALAFMKSRPAIAIGAAVLVLSVVGVAVASATRAPETPAWVEQPAAATVARTDSVPSATIPANEEAGRETASARPSARARDERGSTTSVARASEPEVVVPQLTRPVAGRIDSVIRNIQTPERPAAEVVPVQLSGAATDNGPRLATTDVSLGAVQFQRPRLIGSLPEPKYPSRLLLEGEGGEVRVRFDVDTTGRPVMSTFTVVGTPHTLLVQAVRDVVPGMRFEPARADRKPVVDRVEVGFKFNTARARD